MPKPSAPLISVIVAVYNAAATLSKCLDSIASQTFKNFELIVIDGGSSDGSVDLIKRYEPQIAYWISERDLGIYNAWNKGVRQANGEWVCFVGADDYLWNADVFDGLAARLMTMPAEVSVAYSKVAVLNQLHETLYELGSTWEASRTRFRDTMSIPHPALMHRRTLFTTHGEFDESFRIAGDYEMLMRELLVNDAVFIPEVTAVGMLHGGISSDPKNTLVALREVRRAQAKHGLKSAGWRWRLAVARVYIRLVLWRVFGEKTTRWLLDVGRRLMGQRPHWTRT